jgi:hypothetical protein
MTLPGSPVTKGGGQRGTCRDQQNTLQQTMTQVTNFGLHPVGDFLVNP